MPPQTPSNGKFRRKPARPYFPGNGSPPSVGILGPIPEDDPAADLDLDPAGDQRLEFIIEGIKEHKELVSRRARREHREDQVGLIF